MSFGKLSKHKSDSSLSSLDTIDERAETVMYIDTMSETSNTANNVHISECVNVILIDWDDTIMPSSYICSMINYEMDDKAQKLKSLSINNVTGAHDFPANLEKTGKTAYDLLCKICTKYEPSNIKIVTNCAQKWFNDSLIITGFFCRNYQKIAGLLNAKGIDVVFARDENLDSIHWKTKCFDRLLWPYFNGRKQPKLNVTTIGDQWHDHVSIQQTFTYQLHGNYISHHQIKLYENPDCRYLCVEHKYISDLLDDEVLFEPGQGILLEFEGYDE